MHVSNFPFGASSQIYIFFLLFILLTYKGPLLLELIGKDAGEGVVNPWVKTCRVPFPFHLCGPSTVDQRFQMWSTDGVYYTSVPVQRRPQEGSLGQINTAFRGLFGVDFLQDIVRTVWTFCFWLFTGVSPPGLPRSYWETSYSRAALGPCPCPRIPPWPLQPYSRLQVCHHSRFRPQSRNCLPVPFYSPIVNPFILTDFPCALKSHNWKIV